MTLRTVRRSAFAINGRFFSQATTGVQRYGREVTAALDAALAASGERGRLVVPRGGRPDRPFAAMSVDETGGPLGGHAWEQVVLPARAGMPLLNLCNTGPALMHEQVVCIHDANVFLQPESYGPAFRSAYRLLLPLLSRRAMRIATVSRAAAGQLAAVLPVAARDIAILPNGHEHALRWDPSASDVASRLGTRPFVLLLGSRARHKNAGLIVAMADALDVLGLDLVVAGGRAGIFAPIATAPSATIRELGTVSDGDLAVLYRRALCLAFPSFTEGFGLPIVEAMALGCPVVSSDRASMPEVCGDAALLAAPDDPAAWLAHFKALVASPALRQDLCGRGDEQVKRFSWTRTAQGYLDLFGRWR